MEPNTPDSQMLHRDQLRLLKRGIQQLPKKQREVFVSSPYKRDAKIIEKTLVQAFNLHWLEGDQSVPQIKPQPSLDSVYELEWSIKRVVYSTQRESIPDKDVPHIFSKVLQNVATIKATEEKEPGQLKLEKENRLLINEDNFF